jgi:heterotetrameric sarcosine oxidase delta subunit
MRRNVAGVQRERWFHRDGCRRWLTISRNTLTNIVES